MVNAIKDRLVSRLGKSRLLPGFVVALIPGTKTLGAEVEGIAEGLVNACQ